MGEVISNKGQQLLNFRIENLSPQYFHGLEALQVACFPTLAEGERMRVAHYAKQHEIFSEGQFVAVHTDASGAERVVGQGSGFFTDFNFAAPGHNFMQISGELYFTNHDPNGDYYYGADISVHPDYRRRGIGKRLYAARQTLVRKYNKRGIVAGGMLPGFVDHKHAMNAHDYVACVVAGELYDPTLSFQLNNGFRVRGVLENYIDDAPTENWSTLIEWVNPDFQP
jgi:GNAT superfamily N-acetyltransferase